MRAKTPGRDNADDGPARIDHRWPVIGSSRTLAQRVYEVMRDRILANELTPRAYVREEELATAMMVSRTPIREALNRLASEGFLERLPHRGFRVAQRSIEELAHVYTVLQSLELLACELAFPHITPTDLARLEEANAGFAAAIAANDVSTAVDLNDRFHHLFAEQSGNPVLSRLLDDLRQQVHLLEVLDFSAVLLESGDEDQATISRDTWVKQHAEFIEALRAGDQRRALEIMRANRSFVFQKKVDQARANARAAAGFEADGGARAKPAASSSPVGGGGGGGGDRRKRVERR
jgi:DNA-binding GntR family transcriptional regulator